MKLFQKSAKYIVAYLAIKWFFILVVGWQISKTDWFKDYYANDYAAWHLLIVPATLMPIILFIRHIKSKAKAAGIAVK